MEELLHHLGWCKKEPVNDRITYQPQLDTPRKINMEPENTPLEKENHLPNHHFQVLNLWGCSRISAISHHKGQVFGRPPLQAIEDCSWHPIVAIQRQPSPV